MSPSLHLSIRDQIVILQHVLGKRPIVDGLEALQHIFSTPYELPQETEEITSSFGIVNERLETYRSLTVDLVTKEASGRALLGVIILELTNAIQKEDSTLQLKVDHEHGLLFTSYIQYLILIYC